MTKTIRSHSEVWFLHVQTSNQDTEAAIEEAQNLFTAGNQAPISEGSSDKAAPGQVLAATLSFAPGCSVVAAKDQGWGG